jgi:transposase
MLVLSLFFTLSLRLPLLLCFYKAVCYICKNWKPPSHSLISTVCVRETIPALRWWWGSSLRLLSQLAQWGAKRFPLDWSSELQLHIWREKGAVQYMPGWRGWKDEWFKKLAGNGCRGGKEMQTGYSAMLIKFPAKGLFSYGTV